MLSKKVGGHVFGVDVFDVSDAGELVGGARGYEARVEIYRDAAHIGSGRWDVEGLADCVDGRGRPLDIGDNEDAVYDALAAEVRRYLASLPADGGLALAL